MKGYRDSYEGEYPLEEVLWWKIDDDHYQTLIVYPSEEMENPERKKLKEARNNIEPRPCYELCIPGSPLEQKTL